MSRGQGNDQGNGFGGHGPARMAAWVMALAVRGPGIWLPESLLYLSGGWEMTARGRGDVSHVLALAVQGYRHEKAVLSEW